MSARRYLEEFGVQIAKNGYAVIPIRPGEKRPWGEKWQTYDGSPEGVRDWLKSGRGDCGVGIKTKNTPAVDIDVHDPEIVSKLQQIVFDIAGHTLQRVGLPPKMLLAYRTDEPFPKVDTGFWVDQKGRTAKVEILGDGQQFVAAHIHPDTGKPYQWLNGGSVLKTRHGDLPILTKTLAEQIREAALKVFMEEGYQRKSKTVQRLVANHDPDDPFAAVKAKTVISDEKLFNKLMMVPNNDDYDTWFFTGMALYHQYDGSQEGLDLWHQWSASANNYDAKVLDDKWPTFNIAQKDREPITARWILRQAKDEEDRVNKEVLQTVFEGLNKADDLPALQKVCETIKQTQFDVMVREMLIGRVKKVFQKITGTAPRIGVVREMTRYESPENRAMPGWLKNWVYCQHDKTLFNMVDRRSLDRESFDASHARLLLTPSERNEGKSIPETPPFAAAMNLYQVPVVYNKMYLPGMDQLYKLNDIAYVNTYTDVGIPEIPGELDSAEKQAIETFLAHFEHLIADELDRSRFLDFLTYVVQNPGQRVNWAILLQGTEGDGKSFFSSILKAVLGESNVNVIRGKEMEEKYNPWAEGALVCFVEEVRLHGTNRFDAINTLKPMITNVTVTIRRMNTNVYEVMNTMSYILTSNLKDALPVGDEDSRFYPIFTRFQTQAALRAFNQENPDYYNRLFAITSFGGALRKFFLERKVGPDFNPRARAPASSARREMIALNRSPEEQSLIDALEESTKPDFCDMLLDSGLVANEFMGREALAPGGKNLARLLSTQGFAYLGRYRINDEKRQFWSRRPEIWPSDDLKRGEAIRGYLDPKGL